MTPTNPDDLLRRVAGLLLRAPGPSATDGGLAAFDDAGRFCIGQIDALLGGLSSPPRPPDVTARLIRARASLMGAILLVNRHRDGDASGVWPIVRPEPG